MTSPAPVGADPSKAHVAKDLVHGRPLISCRFDPKGRYVFAGSEDTNVLRWDLASGAKTVLEGHESWPFALGVTPDGETLLSCGGEGKLICRVFGCRQGNPV